MFSGCYEDNLDHDSEGRVFLDFDPQLFQSILSSLRSCNIRDSTTPVPLQRVDTSKLAAYLDLVKYLGLKECMGYRTYKLKLMQSESNYYISHEGQCAKSKQNTNNFLTLDEVVTDVGYMKFACRPRSGGSAWITVGVADADKSHVENGCAPFCRWQKEYRNDTADGSWIMIKVDMCTGKLSMLEPNCSPCHKWFSADKWGQCVFQVAVNTEGCEIELLPVTTEDQHMFM